MERGGDGAARGAVKSDGEESRPYLGRLGALRDWCRSDAGMSLIWC
jgi:hypothetical protein